MCEKPQPRYNTVIPPLKDISPYRNTVDEVPWWFRRIQPRSIFYPNDMDILAKTYDGAKNGLIAGIFVGLIQANQAANLSERKNLPITTEAFMRHFPPTALAGIVYGFSTSVSANIRHEDDYINHVVGGLTGGSVYGMWYKNPRMLFWSAVGGGIVAGVIKFTKQNSDMSKPHRRRIFNHYRRRWLTDPVPEHGTEDDETKYYRP